MWMDASTRFRNGNVTAILRHADKRGLYVSRNGWMLPQHVAQPMMDYFRVSWTLQSRWLLLLLLLLLLLVCFCFYSSRPLISVAISSLLWSWLQNKSKQTNKQKKQRGKLSGFVNACGDGWWVGGCMYCMCVHVYERERGREKEKQRECITDVLCVDIYIERNILWYLCKLLPHPPFSYMLFFTRCSELLSSSTVKIAIIMMMIIIVI